MTYFVTIFFCLPETYTRLRKGCLFHPANGVNLQRQVLFNFQHDIQFNLFLSYLVLHDVGARPFMLPDDEAQQSRATGHL